MYRKTYAEIDLARLEANLRAIASAFARGTFLCPMVKANAYGHGDVLVARALESFGVRRMGVCLIEEGLRLREAGVRADILVFRGFDRDGAREIVERGMVPVVSSWEQIEHLEAVARAPIAVHLKFDTGMNRLGFGVEEREKVFARVSGSRSPLKVEGVLTHLFNGEDAGVAGGDSERQLVSMASVAETFRPLSPIAHALNSAGLVRKAAGGGGILGAIDWGLRPGLLLYGVNPVSDSTSIAVAPVMSLRAHVGTYRTLRSGDTVSYGATWTARRDSIIAVVPIGYADGYHRILSNRAEALFAGERVPVVGAVCMDYLMLDVTDVVRGQNLSPNSEREVTLFGRDEYGREIGSAELAAKAGTIPWEIMTSVGERVPRVLRGAAT